MDASRLGFWRIYVMTVICKYLDLWGIHNHNPPESKPEHIPELVYDYSESQIPVGDYWSWYFLKFW